MRHHLRGALQFGDKGGKLVGDRDVRSRYPAWPCECAAGDVTRTASFLLAAQFGGLIRGALQCCWATSERGTSAEAGVTGRRSTAVGSDENDAGAVELSAHPLDS